MTTASDLTRGKEAEREVLPASVPEALRRQGRTCATSVALPSASFPQAATQRVQWAGAKAASLLEKPGTLPHAQPPTFVEAHARHRECAAHFRTPLFRWLRMTWGWFHLLVIKPALNGLEHYTESPLAALIVAAIAVTIWLWS